MIGPEGGEIQIGEHRIIFPEGAVPELTEFRVNRLLGLNLILDIHATGYAQYRFQRPIRVQLNHANCAVHTRALTVLYINVSEGRLLEDMGGNELDGHIFEFSTDHLSAYALAAT